MIPYLAAAIQMDSGPDKESNLNQATALITEAAAKGAALVALPEHMHYLGPDKPANAEPLIEGETFRLFSALAKSHHLWLQGGSIYEINPDDPARPYNTSFLINPQGKLAAAYRKTHLFDVNTLEGGTFCESAEVTPGAHTTCIDTEAYGVLGLAICYDVRFPRPYRLMAEQAAQVFITSTDFILKDKVFHWEPLVLARAIENSCYHIVPGQCGLKAKFQAYGRSLIADPWGNILAQAGDTPGVITATIDLALQQSVAAQMHTAVAHRDLQH